MSRVAATVNIVTTDGLAGRDGMAVTAMSSVSADTELPTLLICINAASRPAPVILGNEVFCVNVLTDDQSMLCDCFAGLSGGNCDQWFHRGSWGTLSTGAPVLDEALVNFDCQVSEVSRIGTHYVIFGAVQTVRTGPVGRPLLHANRSYCRLADLPHAKGSQQHGLVGDNEIRSDPSGQSNDWPSRSYRSSLKR